MVLIAPLLAEMGVNAALVSGAVIAAQVALFVHKFLRRGI